MCNLTRKVNMAKCRNRQTEEVYAKASRTIPYETVQPFHCAWTGEPLDKEYVLRSGQTPKAFSEEVYQGVVGNRRATCFMCGEGLSPGKQSGQDRQPREIVNHMCPECEEYMALVYRKVAGIDNSFLADEQQAQAPRQHYHLPPPGIRQRQEQHVQLDDPDVVDAEYSEDTPGARAILHTPIMAIDYQPMTPMPDFTLSQDNLEMLEKRRQRQPIPVYLDRN